MHEMSMAESMLRIVEAQLGGKREMLFATVTIGPLSGISPDALCFCFTEVADVMGFGRPELRVKEVAARAFCRDCLAEYEMHSAFDFCPKCHSLNRRIVGGDGCTLESVEVMGDDAEQTDAD